MYLYYNVFYNLFCNIYFCQDDVYWTDLRRKAIFYTNKYNSYYYYHTLKSNIEGIMDIKIMHKVAQMGNFCYFRKKTT